MYSGILQTLKNTFQSVFLMETDIGIAVAVLYPDDDIADRCYSWTVTSELFVGHFCVKFLRLNELVVKIKVIYTHIRGCSQIPIAIIIVT